MTIAAAETRSFHRAELVMRHVGDQPVSAKTIERVVHDVGWELAKRRDAHPKTADTLAQCPESAWTWPSSSAMGDGFAPASQSIVPACTAPQRAGTTKNACLIRPAKTSGHDPQPEPPECFCQSQARGQNRRDKSLVVAAPRAASSPEVTVDVIIDMALPLDDDDWRPKRLVVRSRQPGGFQRLGKQMAREAKRRRFFEAKARAFLGDGLPWNWSIWKAIALTSLRSSISFMC